MASFYKSPASLLDELGIREPEEIAIEAIAEYCGATILYQPLQGAEARIVGHGDRAIITVNEAAPLGRRRFSGAHELGHWMCDRGKIAFACTDRIFSTEWSDENPERRANRYAVALLLPNTIFSPHARNRAVTFATVQDLADRFRTSLTATAIRLVELASFPAIIVCTESGRRRWFIRGPDVPDILWPRERPTHNTVAWDLLQGKATPSGPVDVCADGWFDHPNAGRYVVREDSRRIREDLILSILWWKDERQLLDLDEDEEDAEEE